MNDIRTFLKGWKETDAPALVASVFDDVSQTKLMMVENEIKDQYKSESIITKLSQKQSKERLGNMHGTKATVERFNKVYPRYTFIRTIINNWKLKMKKEKDGKTIFKKKGRPNFSFR